MSEYLPNGQITGNLENELVDDDTYDTAIALLESVFPKDYDGDTSIPDDASSLFLAHGLTQSIWPESSQIRERDTMFVVSYRTLEFAYALSTLIKPDSNNSLDINGVFGDVSGRNSEEVIDQIYQKGDEYLAHRPRLASIVHRFVNPLSPHPSLKYPTTAMCGVWLRAYDDGNKTTRLNIFYSLDN